MDGYYVPGPIFADPLAITSSSGDNLVSGQDIPPLSLFAEVDVPSLTQSHSPGPINNLASVALNENDIVIAVMGHTGVGKSSFVNIAAGPGSTEVGSGLKPQTRTVKPIRCAHPDGRRNIVLVDTPGLDLPDVLELIADWLKKTYPENVKLAGILYFHRISDVKMVGVPKRSMTIFNDLCGEGGTTNIFLVTTMWDLLEDQSVGSEREEELLSKYWKNMIIDRLILGGSRRATLPIQDHRTQPQEPTAARNLFLFLIRECTKVWGKIRQGVRGRRILSESYQPRAASTSTLGSGASETGRSILSMGISTNLSASGLFGSVEGASSSCSAYGRRETLSAMVRGLKTGDNASVPVFQELIGIILQIARMIEEMGGAHHTISEVVEYSGYLIEEIAQSTRDRISKDMKKTLGQFRKELKSLHKVVKMVSKRGSLSRFLLHDADIQVISACATAIRTTYGKLEVGIAADNLEAITRLEGQLTKLRDNQTGSRHCECGRLVALEEPGPPMSRSSQSLLARVLAS